MPNVILFSEHVYESPRRAGFHWLADAYVNAGWNVCFVTVGFSPFSVLKRDFRRNLLPPRARNIFRPIREHLQGYAWYTPYHPMNLKSRLVNAMTTPIFRNYPTLPMGELESVIAAADTIILESSAAISLPSRLKAVNSDCFLVYRVSDDLCALPTHPLLRVFEQQAVPHLDLISVPSDFMVAKYPSDAPVAVQYHGLEKALLDTPTENPYASDGRKNIVSVGGMMFDVEAVTAFAGARPDVNYHIFGEVPALPSRPNLFAYGEQRFVDLIPYLQHADAGLAPYRPSPDLQYLAHTSNKMMQYTWCRLPILLPSSVPATAAHVVSYTPGDDFGAIVECALSFDRSTIDRSTIKTWEEVRQRIEAQRPGPRKLINR